MVPVCQTLLSDCLQLRAQLPHDLEPPLANEMRVQGIAVE